MDNALSDILINAISLSIMFLLPYVVADIKNNRNKTAIFTLSFLSVLPTLLILFVFEKNSGNIPKQLIAGLLAPAAFGFSYIGWSISLVWALMNDSQK